MRFFNWAETFKEQPTCEDILKKVRKAEIKYWIFLVISVAVAIEGINMVIAAPENNIKRHTIGLILVIAGLINIALMKLWAHIILTTYYLIWDNKNRVEAEIRKSEAADL
jgi:hypothetical protein